jgi:hypothetical protein
MEEKLWGRWVGQRDLPDFRDYTPQTPVVDSILTKSQPLQEAMKAAPSAGICASGARTSRIKARWGRARPMQGVGLAEYFQRRPTAIPRRLAPFPLQDDAQPAGLDGRHRRLFAILDDEGHGAVRHSARTILAYTSRFRQRSLGVLLCDGPELQDH